LVEHTVDAKELARLYVGERLTAEEVAKRIGCSETTVRRRLRSQALNVRSRGPRRREPATVGWTRERAYAIGLLATDGNLSRDGRHLTVTSADPDLLGVLRACLALQANVRQVGSQGRCYRVQWSDRRFYEWVESIGLSPAKSRTLGALTIPDEYFADFARGCIDGDGSIVVYVDRYHSAKDGVMSMNACMSRSCRPVERSSIGSGPACYDSWESAARSRRECRGRAALTGCFAMHGVSPADCCPGSTTHPPFRAWRARGHDLSRFFG
jgi:hypothetical protein